METDLVLVSLNDDQISKAKEASGKRKLITHALVFGKYGTMFGTEKQCRKYYSAWKEIFKSLFGSCYETDNYDLKTYKCSGNVVMNLIAESDKSKPNITLTENAPKSKKKGFWSKLFGG
jgi:hypothetical protein